jgi:hypothetical protein
LGGLRDQVFEGREDVQRGNDCDHQRHNDEWQKKKAKRLPVVTGFDQKRVGPAVDGGQLIAASRVLPPGVGP